MSTRTSVTAAVVAALFIGGATTGVTLASWRDAAALGAGSTSSGIVGLRVDGSTAATFPAIADLALNSGATPGAARSFTATLVNTGTGKNNAMRMYLTDVTTTDPELDSGLEISIAGVASSDACPTPTYAPLSGANSHELTTGKVGPGGARKLCVSIRVEGSPPSAMTNQSGPLTFAFRGDQVRP